jgi:hypothetical protein
MNAEERLADALHSIVGPARPSPDLADRIVERVSVAEPRRVGPIARFGLAAAAVLALAAVALLPLAIGTRPNLAAEKSHAPTAAPTGLAHIDRDGLAFDYPAAWTATTSGQNMRYVTVLEYVGTGSGLATCVPVAPGPSDQFISGTNCSDTVKVGPGQVVVELMQQDGPPRPGPINPSDPSGLDPTSKYVTVGGLPAIFSEGRSTDSPVTLDWTLSVPGELMSRYRIHVEMKAPGVDEMRAQVEALVASVKYVPPVPVLNPADGPRIAAVGLTRAAANDQSFACFPKEPGTSVEATISQFPMYSQLRRSLPVTCTTQIAPNAIGLWKMSLTESWTAASDRSAGSLTTTLWLAPDGTPGQQDGGSPISPIPYWP